MVVGLFCAMAKLKVLVIKNNQVLQDGIYLLNGSTTIGRSESCNIQIDLPGVSRCHCTIVRLSSEESRKKEYSILDGCFIERRLKKSTNGILLNGDSVISAYLKNGDVITLIDKQSGNKSELAQCTFLLEDRDTDNAAHTLC